MATRITKLQTIRTSGLLTCAAAIFLSTVVAATYFAWIPMPLGVVYLALSLLTFGVYAIDKSKAKRGGWRIPEKTLHLLSLVGGWPGALLAQQLLRHKSSKTSFRIVFWLTLCINLGAIGWMMSPDGQASIHSLIAVVS
ncbi:DUF1294 domain-containing protein [Pontibacterium sp.]|uniref:DUF1294 domain-containing protein n=1 Tax=Pontibacterium sp. TaxID=2036026 RepID=UPI00356AFC45